MASFSKRKIVISETLNDYNLPECGEIIAKVQKSRGNNLHEVVDENGDEYLVSMPTKFRKKLWIKRGDYVVLHPIEEGQKVRAEITKILYKEQIRYFRDQGRWPKNFDDIQDNQHRDREASEEIKCNLESEESASGNSDTDSDSDSELFQNPNRPRIVHEETSDSSEQSDDNASSEEEE